MTDEAIKGCKFTPRGFEDFITMEDAHHNVITVRESSVYDGLPPRNRCVWVFCQTGPKDARTDSTPYLNVDQARRLALALMAFCMREEDEG